MEQPLVSIITPTYNHEKYIADCIRSVLAQEYRHWEMLIVDDGSPDGTLQIAREFAAQDPRIQVFTRENVGIFRLAETYNFALRHSKGKYIAVLEGDDIWFSQKLAIQIPRLEEKEDCVLSWGEAYATDEQLQQRASKKEIPFDKAIYYNDPVGSSAPTLLFQGMMSPLTVVIRKTALDKINGFIQKFNIPAVDLATWQVLSLVGKFDYVEEYLGCWRYYMNQVTKTYPADIYNGNYLLAKEFYHCNPAYFPGDGWDKKIDRFYARKRVIAYSRSGRYNLARKKFKEARKAYYISIFKFGCVEPLWKLRSLVGLCFSFFHMDIEGLAKAFGRISYK